MNNLTCAALAVLGVLMMDAPGIAQVAISPTGAAVPTLTPQSSPTATKDIVEPTAGQRADVVAFLLAKRESLLISLEGKRARFVAVQKTTEELLAEARQLMKSDQAMVQYGKALTARQELLQNLQHAGATAREINDAMVNVAGIQAEIADREEVLRGRIRGGVYPELARSVVEAMMDIRELESELVAVDERLGHYKQVAATPSH